MLYQFQLWRKHVLVILLKHVLEAMGVDYIDESEVLTPADEEYHLRKDQFTVPFVCGCRNLGEAARRIGEVLQCYVQR